MPPNSFKLKCQFGTEILSSTHVIFASKKSYINLKLNKALEILTNIPMPLKIRILSTYQRED